MRLPRVPGGNVPQIRRAGDGGASGGRSHADVDMNPLRGSWSATRWQYGKRGDPAESVDVVCDLGGSVTLSLSDGAYVLTWDRGDRNGVSVGGAFDVQGDTLELRPQGANEAESVRFLLGQETLTLRSESSGWDFDGDGQEAVAEFVAVFVRL